MPEIGHGIFLLGHSTNSVGLDHIFIIFQVTILLNLFNQHLPEFSHSFQLQNLSIIFEFSFFISFTHSAISYLFIKLLLEFVCTCYLSSLNFITISEIILTGPGCVKFFLKRIPSTATTFLLLLKYKLNHVTVLFRIFSQIPVASWIKFVLTGMFKVNVSITFPHLVPCYFSNFAIYLS